MNSLFQFNKLLTQNVLSHSHFFSLHFDVKRLQDLFSLWRTTTWTNEDLQSQNQHPAHLVSPPPPAGPCAEPGTSPRHTAPRSCPPLQTAGTTYSMTRCHTLKGHVSDHAHRTCWTITRIREREVEKVFTPTYQERGTYNPKFTVTETLYLCKSVQRDVRS